jgi:hypothetical protein
MAGPPKRNRRSEQSKFQLTATGKTLAEKSIQRHRAGLRLVFHEILTGTDQAQAAHQVNEGSKNGRPTMVGRPFSASLYLL